MTSPCFPPWSSRIAGALRLEEVLLVAVAGLGQRADELRKELGRDAGTATGHGWTPPYLYLDIILSWVRLR